jgi:hypothetical protein
MGNRSYDDNDYKSYNQAMKPKHVSLTLVLLFYILTAIAQQGINYKAIIHDSNGDPVGNIEITVQFTILENGITAVYQETHTPTTDPHGIIVVNIGEGSVMSGDFSTIDWGTTPHFLKTEINTGEGFTDMGTTAFTAVPYALHAETANQSLTDQVDDADADPFNEIQSLNEVLAAGSDAGGQALSNLANPVNNQDAATKVYVDEIMTILENSGISIVDFTCSKVRAIRDEVINFDGISRFDATEWLWDFGDGITGSGQQVDHSYSTEGIYSVELTASNGLISRTILKLDCIRVTRSVQQRLDEGDTPFEIMGDGFPVDSLIGKYYQGGLIFYLNYISGYGFIAADNDLQGQLIQWGFNTILIGNTETELGFGEVNTDLIYGTYLGYGLQDIPCAAILCYNLELNGYDDWFLPSLGELQEMQKIEELMDYAYFSYWSSSEVDISEAYVWSFYFGASMQYEKQTELGVIPIRRFDQ